MTFYMLYLRLRNGKYAELQFICVRWKRNLTGYYKYIYICIYIYIYIWTLTKRLEKKLDGNYTRMLRTILNKSWRQHPTKHQLYGHLPSFTKTIKVRQTRHAGHCWRSRDELISDVLRWISTYGRAKAVLHTYIYWIHTDAMITDAVINDA